MKREILFKGKSVKSNEWVHGNLVRYMGNQDEFTDAIQVLDDEKKVKCVVNVIPETIGQFTGLIDKNGVKIFDGDICTLPMTNCQGIEEKTLLEIVYDAPEFKYKIIESHIFISGAKMSILDFENLEVIGNIHDKK